MRLAIAFVLAMTLATLGVLGLSYLGELYLGTIGLLAGFLLSFALGVLFVVWSMNVLDDRGLL